jgi:hypothetical protein
MFGIGGSDSGGPMDFLRNRVDQWRAHPFQQIASTVAGGFGGPAAGFAANRGFDAYNNNQFNNSAQTGYDRSQQQTNMDANSAISSPLNGPLGNYDRSGQSPYGSVQGGGGQGDMGGSSGGMAGGGPSYGGYQGPTQSSQQWMGNTGGFQGIQNQMNGSAPGQPSQFVNDILNSISTGPGQPGTGFNGQGSKHDQIMANGGMPGLYGVSNFMAGGTPVINGMQTNDMNSVAMANRRMFDH